jgi:hypothetical protein
MLSVISFMCALYYLHKQDSLPVPVVYGEPDLAFPSNQVEMGVFDRFRRVVTVYVYWLLDRDSHNTELSVVKRGDTRVL